MDQFFGIILVSVVLSHHSWEVFRKPLLTYCQRAPHARATFGKRLTVFTVQNMRKQKQKRSF